MKKCLIPVLAAIALGTANCKPSAEQTSEVRSLDNFAAGKVVTQNTCGTGKHSVDKRWDDRIVLDAKKGSKLESKQRTYKTLVKRYLTSVPASIQETFLDIGGVIVLSGKAHQVCTAGFKNKSSDQYVETTNDDQSRDRWASCMHYDEVGKGNALFAVWQHVNEEDVDNGKNEARIMHGGVRIFGLMFGQLFSRALPNQNPDSLSQGKLFKLMDKEPNRMSQNKNALANRFLMDMFESDDKRFDLANLEAVLGKGSKRAINSYLQNFKGNITAANPLSKATFRFGNEKSVSGSKREVRMARFEDFVFGEAFDSFHCSVKSRKIMKDSFARSEKSFDSMNQEILRLAKSLAAIEPQTALGLQGKSLGTAPGIAMPQSAAGNWYDQILASYGGSASYAQQNGFGQATNSQNIAGYNAQKAEIDRLTNQLVGDASYEKCRLALARFNAQNNGNRNSPQWKASDAVSQLVASNPQLSCKTCFVKGLYEKCGAHLSDAESAQFDGLKIACATCCQHHFGYSGGTTGLA